MFLTLASVVCSDASAQNISVTEGDVQTNVAPVTYDSISVSGTSALGAASTYTAAADLTLTNGLSVSSSGVFNANANVTAAGVSSSSDGVINLNAGTLTAGNLSLSGPSSVTRTGGFYSVSNLYLSNGASLTYGDGDSITNYVSLDGGSFSKTRNINAGYFNVRNATFDLIDGDSFNNPYADYWSPNTVATGGVLNVNGDVTVAGWVSAHSGGIVNLNGDMTVGGTVQSYAGGVVNLNNFNLTAGGLSLAEPTSLTRNGGHYSVGNLSLSNGASLIYGDGDSISGALSIDGGSLSKTRTINAGSFNIRNATFDLIDGDSFNNPYADYWSPNTVATGGVLNVNGDVTVAGWVSSHSGGIVNLNGGAMTAGVLALSGPNSLTRTGGNYSVSNLYLSNGASLTYGDGDSITNHLSIDGISSSFAGYEPLSLNSLSITNGGVLSLHAFTGSGAFSNWGLRLLGDSQSFLETLITGSRITGTWGPMSVFYDPTSNYTFVTATAAVPEIDPAGIGSVIALVSGALALLERRKRSA
jgi:hypothetical protein